MPSCLLISFVAWFQLRTTDSNFSLSTVFVSYQYLNAFANWLWSQHYFIFLQTRSHKSHFIWSEMRVNEEIVGIAAKTTQTNSYACSIFWQGIHFNQINWTNRNQQCSCTDIRKRGVCTYLSCASRGRNPLLACYVQSTYQQYYRRKMMTNSSQTVHVLVVSLAQCHWLYGPRLQLRIPRGHQS